jgi:YidC/Oxa1 family membrane protein insertase
MIETLIVQPIFNVLTLIYAVLPGHNFGAALIIFTILVRLSLWPLVKKQLHNTKKMRELQPELKKIKLLAKGDRTKEAELTMALYKEREVNPFSAIGLLLLQLPILLALYAGINRIVKDPQQLIDFSYPFIQNMSSMQELAADITKLDFTLFGIIDLNQKALSSGVIVWGPMLLVVASVVVQYLSSKQLMVTDKNARTLRQIMKETAASGQQADQAEVSAAVSRMMVFIIPGFIFIFTVGLPAALALYFLVGGLVAYFQQWRILGRDKVELEAAIDKIPVEAELVDKPKNKRTSKKKRSTKKKRR